MEDFPKDNEGAFQDKPDGSEENPSALVNPVSPSVTQDASVNQQSRPSIAAEISSRSAVPSSASSSQSPNFDRFDETKPAPANPSSEKPNVEAGIGETSANRRSEGNSDESTTPADDVQQQSPSHSETGVARIDVEETEERPTSSQYGSNDSGSLAELCNPDDLHPIGSLTNFPPKENETNIHSSNFLNASSAGSNKDSVQPKEDSPNSDSSSIVIVSQKSPVVSSEVTTIPTDKDSSSKPLAQNLVVSDSLAGHSNDDDAHRTKSCNNAPPEQTLGEKEGTSKSGPDPPNRTSKPNVKPTSELKKSSGTRSLETLLKSLAYELSISINLPEIQDAEVPMQENRSDPLLATKQSESISGKRSTSFQRLQVGMDEVPPYLDVHKGQPSTSSHQPVISEGSSADNRFNSSLDIQSGVEGARTNKRNTSSEFDFLHVYNAHSLLKGVAKNLKKSDYEEHLIESLDVLFTVRLIHSHENARPLQSRLLSYLFLMNKGKELPSVKETLEYPNEITYDILFRIVVEVFVSIASDWSISDFEAIMDSYRSFKIVYEKCLEFKKNNKDKIQDEDSRARMKSFEMILLQTRNAFQLLLLYIGGLAEQESIDRYVKDLLEDDKQYLRRRIG